jgi:tRNA-2-methylthio-N6-dimethylallyladenosine synthase
MGRGYTREDYVGLVASLRAAREGLAISTDLIVGFPGETEEEFEETMALVADVRFALAFAFKYSPRPQTAAPRLGPPVPAGIADRRLQRLFALQDEIQLELNQALVGETMSTLVTGWGREAGTMTGRTPCHRVVTFPAPAGSVRPGELVEVRIEQAREHSLAGALAGAA